MIYAVISILLKCAQSTIELPILWNLLDSNEIVTWKTYILRQNSEVSVICGTSAFFSQNLHTEISRTVTRNPRMYSAALATLSATEV